MSEVLISATDLARMAKDATVIPIDTRSPDAYAAGHVPGAVNIHEIFTYLATSTPEGMIELTGKFADAFGKAGLSGKETAVVYEQSMDSGFGQSCRGNFLLTALGYKNVKVLHGGFNAWTAEDQPVSTETPPVSDAAFPVDPASAAIMLNASDMLAALDKPDIAILDVQLGDGIVYPLAEQMMAEDVAVIFHSGQLTPSEVAQRFPNARSLHKPCPPAAVIDTIQRVTGTA
jgi:thiosulfate/3-mercaptopyruvate sulfurtransferase